jgi:CheY-like chemotaxis protein
MAYILSGTRILMGVYKIINLFSAKKTLATLQATFTTAMNGQEALDSLEKDHNYNLILLDLEMPVLNGYETITILKERYPHIPVLACTASLVAQPKVSDLLASGFSDIILKPYQTHQLLYHKKNTLKLTLA